MIIDPMDYVPFIGATVNVNGLPRSQAGTAGEAVPKHIPIGGTFIKPPANECEIFMGSSTVCVDGDAFTYLALPVLSCHDVGLVPPPRPKKKSKTKSMVLPTSVVLCVPGGPPVLVGGAPTISLMALGMRIGMAGLGKAFKKFKKKFKKFRKKKGKGKKPKKGKSPDNAPCGTDAHPVDVVTGACVDTCIDYVSPAPFPFRWIRHYDSADAQSPGVVGAGFRHEYQRTLEKTVDGFTYVNETGEEIQFPSLPEGAVTVASAGTVLRKIDETHYQVIPHRKPVLLFAFRVPEKPAVLLRISVAAHSLSLTHDAAGRLTEIAESDGERFQLQYDESGRINGINRLADGGATNLYRYEYSSGGCLIAATDALGHRLTYAYDGQKRLTRLTDRNGYSFTYEYDRDGRVARTSGQDGLWEATFKYQPEIGLTTVKYMDGGEWTKAYNADGLITAVIDPYGGGLHREIGGDGQVVSETDAAGHKTEFLYNDLGAHVGKRDHLGHFSLPYAEEPFTDDPLAPYVPTTPVEWEFGQVLSRSALRDGPIPAADREQFTSSLLSELSSILPAVAEGNRPTSRPLEYDALGRPVTRSEGGELTARWQYNAEGRPIQLESSTGIVRRWEYQSWNLIAREFDALGNKVSYGYSFRGEITKVTDPGETKTVLQRDQKERVVKVVRNGVTRDEYRWDLADQLVEKLDGEGKSLIRFEVGPNGLPVRRILASGEIHQLKYDEHGRLVAAATDKSKTTIRYTPNGRRCEDKRGGKGTQHRYVEDRVVETAVLGSYKTRFAYPQPGVIQITDPAGGVHVITFSKAGIVQRSLSNGTQEIVRFNAEGLCVAKVAVRPTAPSSAWSRAYHYGPGQRLLEIKDSQNGSTQFAYDAAGRLVEEKLPDNTRRAITYDPAGNILAKHGLEQAAVGPGNRLQSVGGERFTYNPRHQVAEVRGMAGATRYQYDSREQLIGVDDGEHQWKASYDPLGRRTTKQYRSQEIQYYWDGERLVAEVHKDGRTRIYVYVDDTALVPLLFIDYAKPDAAPGTGTRYFVFTNQIGAPVRAEDDQGNAVWTARIGPYGTVNVDPASAIQFHLRFPGHYHDPEIGLHYNRHRYYSPRLGRYIQSDPIGLAGGLNLYAYPANPLVKVDTNGLTCDGPSNKANGAPDAEAPPKRTEVKKGEDVGDVAKKSGMEKEHLEKLSRRSQETGDIIIVRASNPKSLDYHGLPGHTSKPLDCKLKTAKPPDPHAGLVKKPDAAQYPKGVDDPKYKDDMAHFDDLTRPKDGTPPGKGWSADGDGVMRDADGNKVYGDHDLQGVYHKDEFADAHHKVNTDDPNWQKDLNKDVCPENQMFNHGANDNFKKPDPDNPGKSKMGRQPDADEKYVITEPDGTVRHIDGTDELQKYYNEKG
ncbi:MAG TPA: RHS repeat-associated core domain-containing protein, partial [Verrucomicrobiae bacterium]|nr:RHS repeat-associated core domain-containing protein [Verrucomicrobiae bacterium]